MPLGHSLRHRILKVRYGPHDPYILHIGEAHKLREKFHKDMLDIDIRMPQKHPSVSLHKTLNAIGHSSKLYPMALLSTGPLWLTPLHAEKPPYRFPHTAAVLSFIEQVAVRP